LGRGLKTLEIDIRMNSNDPNHHLVWFLRNFPLTVEDFSLTIQFVRSTPVQISDPEKVERSEQGSVSTTVITANATAQKGKQDHSCNCVMGQDDELAFAVPLSIKNLSLYGFYPLPEPDELEFTPGSSSATRSRTTSPFLTALENLIRRSPELSSIKVDNICHDYGTAIRRTRWLGLEDVTAMLKPYRAKSREFESVIAPRLVKFTSSQGWTDEVLAEFLNRWDSTLSPSKTLNGGQDCQDHRVDHSKDDNDDVENVVVGWKTLELAEVQESFSKTSAAILHQTQHLENLTLSSSEGFPPQELAWILRTSPRLNCFSTIEDNAWPKEGHEYPYLNVFLEAQDLLLPLHQIQGFWSTWTDRKRPHPQNLGWHPKRHGSDNEHGYGGFLAWVASENLEILRVVIKNVPRPDLKRSQFGGTLGQCREGTLAHEDYQDPRVALQVEQELCRRIGRLTNLKELVLGMDDRKWGDLNYYRSLPKRLRKELGLPLLTPVKDPDREEEQKEIGVKDGDNGGTVADEEDVYSDADNAWNECPRWEPLMFYDEGFQYSCLSLALDAGLGYLAGLGQLEVLKVNRMSHRIRLQEVQWMAEHWPRLRRIEGLKVLRKDDKCPIPPVTEEAISTRMKEVKDKSWARVFSISELLEAILAFMDPKTLHTFRLVSRSMRDQCAPFFAITLDITERHRYPILRRLSSLVMPGAEHVASSPLNQIRGLHLHTQNDLPARFDQFYPETMDTVLDRCRNLREIKITDIPGNNAPPEKPSYPPRRTWSCRRFILVQPDSHHGRYCNSDCVGCFGHEDRPKYPDNGKPWSFWDRLPLEGELLKSLESLSVTAGEYTPMNLDRFMTRVGKSCVANTLRSFTVLGSWDQTRTVSWLALRDCLCNLTVLDAFRIEEIFISYEDHIDYDSRLGNRNSAKGSSSKFRWIAPSVKSLTIKCRALLAVKLALLKLFPNLESLVAGFKSEIWERAVDQHYFPNVSSCNDHAGRVPFPKLKSLDAFITLADDWMVSRLLQAWARRQLSFQLVSAQFAATYHPFLRPANEALFKMLCDQNIVVRRIQISDQDVCWATVILTSPVCQQIEALELLDSSLDFVQILKPAAVQAPQHWLLNEEQFPVVIQWSRTLTHLSLRTSLDSRTDTIHGEGALAFVRSAIKMMTQLVDLQLLEPIKDLAFFDGLGRSSPLSGKPVTADVVASSPTAQTFELENYCITERPLLKRLTLCQSFSLVRDPNFNVLARLWSERLHYQFRFLEDFVSIRQLHATHRPV
ncbi:hypothetical protein BGZ83_001281, partial [Gryganskiella cystojenkinii]